jgi:hypothetical protein
MAIRTAVIRLVNVNSVGNIVYKNNATIAKVIANAGTEQRIFEYSSGSAPNAASDGDTTAPNIHEYLVLEEAAGYSIAYMDQTFIITQN